MQSILLPYCWVCGDKTGLNDHHVVPQAYGGRDGPQVTLCASHHTFIHTVALKPRARREHLIIEHVEGDEERQSKLTQLTEVIARARAATRSVEKPMLIQHKLNVERGRKLRELKTLLGKSSLMAALEECVDLVYAQATQLNKTNKGSTRA